MLLDAQNNERVERSPQVESTEDEECPAFHLAGRDKDAKPRKHSTRLSPPMMPGTLKATLCLQKDQEELMAFLRLSSQALAEHSNEQPNRVHLWHNPTSNQAFQGLPVPRWHASHVIDGKARYEGCQGVFQENVTTPR